MEQRPPQSISSPQHRIASALLAGPPIRLFRRDREAWPRRWIKYGSHGTPASSGLPHVLPPSRLEARQMGGLSTSGPASLTCGSLGGASEESPLDSHAESEAEESITSMTAKPVSRQGLEDTKKLVEVAMLAAVTGLAYFTANIVKVEGYIGYVLPLPSVIAAMRWGASTGWRTVLATCFLISVLLGPVRMLTYLCMHGLTAGTMAWMWSRNISWVLGIGSGLVVRTAGTGTGVSIYVRSVIVVTCACLACWPTLSAHRNRGCPGLLGYICISSWTVNENLFQLLLNNIYSLLDQILATAGSSMVPSQAFVIGTCGVFMALNGLVYMLLISVLYAIILRSMGYDIHVPARIHRMMYPPGHPLASK